MECIFGYKINIWNIINHRCVGAIVVAFEGHGNGLISKNTGAILNYKNALLNLNKSLRLSKDLA